MKTFIINVLGYFKYFWQSCFIGFFKQYPPFGSCGIGISGGLKVSMGTWIQSWRHSWLGGASPWWLLQVCWASRRRRCRGLKVEVLRKGRIGKLDVGMVLKEGKKEGDVLRETEKERSWSWVEMDEKLAEGWKAWGAVEDWNLETGKGWGADCLLGDYLGHFLEPFQLLTVSSAENRSWEAGLRSRFQIP